MRTVDLTNIKQQYNKNKTIYLWTQSIGQTIPFVYDKHNGTLMLKDVLPKDKVLVEYNGQEHQINIRYLKIGLLDNIFEHTIEWKYKIGDNIKDKKRDLLIINKKYIQYSTDRRHKFYQYKCLKCGYVQSEEWIKENSLLNGSGCSCCAGKKVVVGINSMSTTNPELVHFLVNKDDANTHTVRSNKKVRCKCPICSYEKDVSPDKLFIAGFSCPRCGDGISYPEKFMHSILQQLHINYIYQYSKINCDWCDQYRYDFYIPAVDMIIETHGWQHYAPVSFGKTHSEMQIIDNNKEKLALEHVSHYVVIDCRFSSCNYIKQSITQSILSTYFNLDTLDYNIANNIASSTLVKQICEEYNLKPESMTLKEFAKNYYLHQTTISRYLRRGNELGLCVYPQSLIKENKS